MAVPLATWTLSRNELTVFEKIKRIRAVIVLLLTLIAFMGVITLYSAGGGSMDPWAFRHAARFAVACVVMLVIACIDVRFWMRCAYPLYAASVLMLVAVDVIGIIGMGAQRWLDLGIISLQPSELMKFALVLALARYYHTLPAEGPGVLRLFVVPGLIVLIPVLLVLKQPDLGTATMLMLAGAGLLFVAGAPLWAFAATFVAGAAGAPIAWQSLHDYQRRRVLTFLDPEADPLGSGYHIMQSKIALGSGGMFGKGFLEGSQSHLNFLPEKQTDFVFTMMAEEWGLTGALAVLFLYMLVVFACLAIAVSARSQFGRLVAAGVTITFFLYVFINAAMVMGQIPVVGVPLPLLSYGGTAMLAVMFGFGLVLSVDVHRTVVIPRHGLAGDP